MGSRSHSRTHHHQALGLLAAVLVPVAVAVAQEPAGSTTASLHLAEAEPRTAQIRALLGGTLDASVEPRSLFDIALDNEDAVQVERARARALLRAVQPAAVASSASSARGSLSNASAPSAPASASAPAVAEGRWRARLDLDRARLDFYDLSRERRGELLQAHAARREAARPEESPESRQAREAEEERQRVLEAARRARSEAERRVGEEAAHLLSVESAAAKARERLRERREKLGSRRELLLGWQRRVRDAETTQLAEADATYDALRQALRATRDELDGALDQLEQEASEVPELGPDPLPSLPPDVPTGAVQARRAVVEKMLAEARAEEHAVRQERASTILDESNTLNRERLGLLPYLSPPKRQAITGFTEVGLAQAQAETRHLRQLLRYHRHAAGREVTSLRQRQRPGAALLWSVLRVMVPWSILVFLLRWWWPRSSRLLALIEERLAEEDRHERRITPGPLHRAVSLLRGIHRPLEGLAFFGLSLWLLPGAVRELLEVQLLSVIIGWTLGGALLVNFIHTLAGKSTRERQRDESAELRLRSLRLVGSVLVGFALVLTLSARLVGEGTVHSWVLSTCWLAALPLFLILVRWWRATIFERVGRARQRSALQAWVLANRRGWMSFLASMVGAVQLFTLGLWRAVRHWVGTFDLTRRAHAYLFKRELDRLASDREMDEARSLPADEYASLSPERPSDAWIGCPADEAIATLAQRVRERRGGVVAVIGARGAGKSSMQRRLREFFPEAVQLRCHANTSIDTLRQELDQAPPKDAPPSLILLDDVDVIIRPLAGGLRIFDDILSHARAHRPEALWVFSIDSVVWPFLRRARDARPLFDDTLRLAPWTDEQIGALLTQRTTEASLTLTFEDLLEPLPPTADEIDRQEALESKRLGYFRMIWDYARGNPAFALEAWRASLVESGERLARVRPLRAPDSAQLDGLPDQTLFVLRAVLQLSPASAAEVAKLMHLSEDHVLTIFRFARSRGYLIDSQGRVQVSWAWLRTVMLQLERRHLVNS